MKKAVHILAKIWMILGIIGIVGCVVAGIVSFVSSGITGAQLSEQGKTDEEIAAAIGSLVSVGLMFIVAGVPVSIGQVVVSAILSKKSNPENPVVKKTYIILGVLSIIFASPVAGILAIVDGATEGQ